MNSVYKNIILCVLLTINNLSSTAQTEYLVTVDPTNAVITKIDSIPGVTWLRTYYIPTYCENIHRYTFVGGDDPSGNPFYLYTIDGISGNTISTPLFANHTSFINLQYSQSGNILYGTFWDSPLAYLVSINPFTGAYSIIRSIPGLSSVSKLIVDESHNRFIIVGPDILGDLTLLTMDINSGNIITQVHTPRINNLVYNKLTDKFYAISNRDGITPTGHYIFSFCTVDPNSGTITNIADLPNIAVFIGGNETLDEAGGRYFFSPSEWNDTANYLYSIDITNGNLINKVAVPQQNIITADNLIQFRYDNIFNKLFALYWEAKTIIPTPVASDSSCRIDLKTKIYPNPSANILIVDKNPTICKVTMNLYNMLGQLIQKDKIIIDGHNEVNLSNLSAGAYYYTFISNGNILLSGKVLKQ